ncbi:gamma carbonic anhydrase family protein [Streptomyces cocklensis]|jgi:carbonic anhydrase/acetyltransferase-like protein (isoleucine patch superfamily)|uniref:Carbonic anhydrase or acetyltransferase, isoleucine patch superfamily n=1 Tax=Actinacidiphila cocklensis TaxID=887465 RepID=A0A9W4GU89_9ACTN|nr:gamma carbonic anhydrase family protein [Actinacidiphila cocklensis]MDD1059783.1 gamma carbonic anhydrase family protein [Actinacidiphila cocklensis]WSX72650.1 gamma carbonic anhydrase family protein [Streptomyces sp. NBC_00899]WSX81281.1 gamma carbonic anhydrase family protein [Streptomyces sp. NBC_00899]CAG6397058.1 Carbonic anhydrase or acetyltransferase, isoleucine patch superfamily [Actinacidiphila cocklensis]
MTDRTGERAGEPSTAPGALVAGLLGARPQIDPTAYVAPTSVVLGRVSLGAGASTWYHAVLRGDCESITVGAGSNIQDNCSVHADLGFPVVVGEGVSVGHNAVLHGCVIEDGVLVGMGATVLNGARIGAGSLVAAQALVPQGMQVPPGSLVAGVPARVRRELTEEERAVVRLNAEHYVALAEVHRDAVGDGRG